MPEWVFWLIFAAVLAAGEIATMGFFLGAVALAALSFAPARIGVFAALACFLAGQLVLALAIDAYGLLEVERTPVTATRVIGLLLVAVGAALVLRR